MLRRGRAEYRHPARSRGEGILTSHRQDDHGEYDVRHGHASSGTTKGGVAGDGARFKAAATGVEVMVFTPVVPFANT